MTPPLTYFTTTLGQSPSVFGWQTTIKAVWIKRVQTENVVQLCKRLERGGKINGTLIIHETFLRTPKVDTEIFLFVNPDEIRLEKILVKFTKNFICFSNSL